MSIPPLASLACFVCGEKVEREQLVALTGHATFPDPTIRLHRRCAPHLAVEALLQFHGLPERQRPSLRPSVAARYGLTSTERRMLQELTRGKTNAEIAHTLGRTEQSVKNAVACILVKLGARSRGEAVAVAIRNGIVE